MAAQNRGIALSGSLSTSCSYQKTKHPTITTLIRTRQKPILVLRSNFKECPIILLEHSWLWHRDLVSHMERLGPSPRNSERLGRRGRSRLGGSETRRSIPRLASSSNPEIDLIKRWTRQYGLERPRKNQWRFRRRGREEESEGNSVICEGVLREKKNV